MKLVVSIYTNEQLDKLVGKVDTVLLMIPHISMNYKDLDLTDAIEVCKKNHIEFILSMDRMYQPLTIELARAFFDKYEKEAGLFYVTDLGVAQIAMEKGLANRVIFDPKTMVTNSLDFEIYASYGFDAIGISAEITLEDSLAIQKKTNGSIFYFLFGHRLMFYSKRHLITLYGEKNGALYPHQDVFFRESTRKDFFPGFENEGGTAMYRSYVIHMLPYLEKLKSMKYGFMESYALSDETLVKVIDIYQRGLRNEDLSILNEEFSILELPLAEGFVWKDSVYQKEELKK